VSIQLLRSNQDGYIDQRIQTKQLKIYIYPHTSSLLSGTNTPPFLTRKRSLS